MATYMTKQRKILLEFLEENEDRKLTAADITSALKASGISVSAVYRNLSALQKDGSIKRVGQNGQNETVYRFVGGHNECKNAIHLSCKKCGKMFHLKSSVSDALLEKLSESENFTLDKGETVLYGFCKECR